MNPKRGGLFSRLLMLPLVDNVNRFMVFNAKIDGISHYTIIEAKDIVYFENIFSFKTKISSNPKSLSSLPSSVSSSSSILVHSIPTSEPRRSKKKKN